MFSNLKLATFTWVLALLTVFITAVIIASSYFVERNIVVIDDTWQLYQTDLSEKARLESAVRAAIGYGGMIHNFKNYLLRDNEDYKSQVESNIGAIKAFLKQYSALELTTTETIAIEDILEVVTAYQSALHNAEAMKAMDYSISEIDQSVAVDDDSALRGLKALRQATFSKQTNINQLSKARIAADLRAALGYGGMIHLFKNYILRHEMPHDDELQDALPIKEIKLKVQLAEDSIRQYRQLSLTDAEKFALNQIESMLMQYSKNLNEIHTLRALGNSIKDIDHAVKVDDGPALRGFQIIEQEVNRQISTHSLNVSKTLEAVNKTIPLGRWASVFTIVFLIFIVILLIRFYVIHPILKLTKNMVRLADNQLDTEITGHQAKNEIGQMARAVMVFKANAIKRFESEEALGKANKALKEKLEENKQLQQRSEEQANKAMIMTGQMISARQEAEKAMAIAEKDQLLVSSILNTVRDGIITINSKGIIETFNPGSEQIFGYKAYEVIGKNISLLMPEPDKSAHDGYLKTFSEGKSTRDQSTPLEQTAQRKNGEIFPVEVTINTIKVANEYKFTGLVRDITERKEKEAQIEKLAMTDSLTGLANRHQFNQRLLEMQQQAKRFKTQFCLMSIDLDKFKPVNDTYGHHVGDILLQKVAELLVFCSREVDTVARLGGDEFSIILNGIHDPKEVEVLAERILDKLKIQFVIENHHIQIGASIGISCYPSDTNDITSLQKMADKALYLSKDGGRNTYHYYHENLTTQKD